MCGEKTLCGRVHWSELPPPSHLGEQFKMSGGAQAMDRHQRFQACVSFLETVADERICVSCWADILGDYLTESEAQSPQF